MLNNGISIHALREEGDAETVEDVFELIISIHALREEGDLSSLNTGTGGADFYPRPPRGGRRCCAAQIDFLFQFLSTPSARRATGLGDKWFQDHQISIHALREEGDSCQLLVVLLYLISIHALREEGDERLSGRNWMQG